MSLWVHFVSWTPSAPPEGWCMSFSSATAFPWSSRAAFWFYCLVYNQPRENHSFKLAELSYIVQYNVQGYLIPSLPAWKMRREKLLRLIYSIDVSSILIKSHTKLSIKQEDCTMASMSDFCTERENSIERDTVVWEWIHTEPHCPLPEDSSVLNSFCRLVNGSMLRTVLTVLSR